ncbi:reverse gyrase [Pyrolobus fumarii 1A]|uniref:Reverse gyrase n=1 Tax=Pyrolobus fumarii (strain DSM 11204 / 1A) TaxID=694429 RepID=G0EEL0_PYRF1|nr:reverse gyrase [Pyrolobus fumarii]AEM38832.1 reverse gyrase [Pyrolobus fumarii 1A]
MAKLTLLYEAGCPNCRGRIDEERLIKGLPCWECLPLLPEAERYLSGLDWRERVLAVARLLEEHGKLEGWAWLAREEDELSIFERFFERATGSRPWSVQRQWARRLLRRESFAITAPTGTGKTTLLAVYALYSAVNGSRVYYLLPTSSLAKQVAERLQLLAHNAAVRKRIVYYHSLLRASEKRAQLEAIENGEYDILVTTTAFLSRRWGLLERTMFDTIIVDDVDAILRDSVNVERILMLLGAKPDEIRAATRLVKLSLRVRANPALARRYASEIEELKRVVNGVAGRLGQLVVASATGRARGFKRLVLGKLLGLSVGSIAGYARNIAEYKLLASSPEDAIEKLVETVAKMGPGGLVFVAKPLGVETAKLVVNRLGERGVRAGLAIAGKRVIEKFERGEYDVLVGVASYYGVMVRGLDMPYRVAYALFLEPPFNRTPIEKALQSPRRILALAKALDVEGYREYARILSKMTPDEVELLRAVLQGRLEAGGRLAEAAEKARSLASAILEKLRSVTSEVPAGYSILTVSSSGAYVATPDPYTYIQASGRTSRLIKGYMTRGVVIVVSSAPLLLERFEDRLARLLAGFELREYNEKEVLEELEKAWESRRAPAVSRSALRMNIETSLVIVESPTKARLIAGFWGKPARKEYDGVNVYETVAYNPKSGKTHVMLIVSVKGHVYDLTEEPVGKHGVILEGSDVKPVYAPIVRCRDCGAQHAIVAEQCPECNSVNIEDKRRIIELLRKLAPLVDTVYIATDPDYEGEKIAWDIYTLLKPYAKNIKRIEFHEVTKKAILEALANPRDVNRRLVEAQVVRRVEDRWIGFELSQHLWKVFNARWLGAGRVQTPALGFLVERLEEWKKGRCYALIARLPWGRVKLCYPDSRTAREALREALEKGVEVEILEANIVSLTPPPPYTTETLLYDASRLLGYTAEKTMRLAQELFENGLITYHRTDSTRVSDAGIAIAKSYMQRRGHAKLLMPRHWGEGGAHEAIRPTMPLDADELRDAIAEGEVRIVTRLRESHYKLYSLIFARFMASQSIPARVERVRLRVTVGNVSVEDVVARKVIEAGFLTFYPHVIPVYNVQEGRVKPMGARIVRTSTVRLYTHGELVMEMKRSGIGRPSTYAKIIEALKRHGYVVESRYRKYLVPTSMGRRVYQYLVTEFRPLVSLERTRLVESLMDSVASGEAEACRVLLELLEEVEGMVARVEAGRGAGLGENLAA